MKITSYLFHILYFSVLTCLSTLALATGNLYEFENPGTVKCNAVQTPDGRTLQLVATAIGSPEPQRRICFFDPGTNKSNLKSIDMNWVDSSKVWSDAKTGCGGNYPIGTTPRSCWQWNDQEFYDLETNSYYLDSFYTRLIQRGMRPLEDGKYIYVLRGNDNRMIVRRDDDQDDNWFVDVTPFRFTDVDYGNGRCKLPDGRNGPAPQCETDNQCDPYSGTNRKCEYQHVTHSQLNGTASSPNTLNAWDPVWCAGELRVLGGQIDRINNASGHFKPDADCVIKYVYPVLNALNIPMVSTILDKDRNNKYTRMGDKERINAQIIKIKSQPQVTRIEGIDLVYFQGANLATLDNPEAKSYLYKINADGTELSNLNQGSNSALVISDSYIFFQGWDNIFYRTDLKGEGWISLKNTTINSPPFIYNGYAYFQNGANKLAKIDIDGQKDPEVLADSSIASSPYVYKGQDEQEWVYFQEPNGNRLWHVKIDGSDHGGINDQHLLSSPWVVSDWIYFQGSGNNLWKVQINGGNSGPVGLNKTIVSPTFFAGYIFFVNEQKQICHVLPTGGALKCFNAHTDAPIFIFRYWVYFKELGPSNMLARVDTNGEQRQYL